MHEHYDKDGAYTGHTVITRESMWDEESRAKALALTDYEDSICKCGCGLPVAVAYDPKQAFKVDTFTCYAGKALEQVKAKYAKDHEKSPEGHDRGLHHYVVTHDD